eukprot:1249227-Karenia_brevis.AAC.1
MAPTSQNLGQCSQASSSSKFGSLHTPDRNDSDFDHMPETTQTSDEDQQQVVKQTPYSPPG